jgi:hypothetical protein
LFGSNTENCEKTEKSTLVHCFRKVKPWSTLLFLASAQTNPFMSDSQTYTAATVKKQRTANVRMSSGHLYSKKLWIRRLLTPDITVFLAAPQMFYASKQTS